jgi:hypothetical protein
MPCGFEGAGCDAVKFLERFALNFFSILLAGGTKIALNGHEKPIAGAAF